MSDEQRLCSVDGCGGKHFGNGFCAKHNYRWKKHGDPRMIGKPKPRTKTVNKNPCPVTTDGIACGRPAWNRGYCTAHYSRYIRLGDVLAERPLQRGKGATWTEREWAEYFNRQPRNQSTSGCIEWAGGKYPSGYGRSWFRGRMQPAHRVSYMVNVGEIPAGMVICHHCDNPPCVNPSHLFLGETADNHADMTAKGRGFVPKPRRGEQHERARVSESDVRAIRKAHADGEPQSAIARRMAIPRGIVSNICLRKTWKHVT